MVHSAEVAFRELIELAGNSIVKGEGEVSRYLADYISPSYRYTWIRRLILMLIFCHHFDSRHRLIAFMKPVIGDLDGEMYLQATANYQQGLQEGFVLHLSTFLGDIQFRLVVY